MSRSWPWPASASTCCSGATRTASTGTAMIVLGLSVSLDELAIGFGLGLLNVPIVPAILLIAAQAFIVSQVGFAIGGKVGEAAREGAENVAGAALILIAAALLVAKILGH